MPTQRANLRKLFLPAVSRCRTKSLSNKDWMQNQKENQMGTLRMNLTRTDSRNNNESKFSCLNPMKAKTNLWWFNSTFEGSLGLESFVCDPSACTNETAISFLLLDVQYSCSTRWGWMYDWRGKFYRIALSRFNDLKRGGWALVICVPPETESQ